MAYARQYLNMHASDGIALAGVIVAVAAVLVALLQENIKRWLWTPRIEIKESQGPAWIKFGPADCGCGRMCGFVSGSSPGERAPIKFRHASLAASRLRSSEAKKRCVIQNF